jgi:hypothetical protein
MAFGNFGKVSGYEDPLGRVLDVNQSILGTALAYDTERNGLEFLSEIYWVKDKDQLAGGSSTNTLYYIQAGYTFMERLTPYARYEKGQIKEGDPYMAALGAVDTSHSVAGIRFDIATVSAIKLEGRHVRTKPITGAENHSEYEVQWAFSF